MNKKKKNNSKKNSKIKNYANTKQASSKRIQSREPLNYNKMPIIFSLERIQSGKYSFEYLDREDKAAFADAIFKRRVLTWNELINLGRHSLGYEKISKDAIVVDIPNFITEDNHNLLVFRYNNKKPMVGYRIKNIFYILWFDSSFSLYDHGG